MRHVPLVVLLAVCTGCKVGPNYTRPDIQPPAQYRAGEAQPTLESLGDMKWFDLFQDPVLRDLIAEALRVNYDVHMAAQRVLQAEGQLSATRASLYPQLNGQAAAGRTGVGSPLQSLGGFFGVASWELDLFGKIRRATEAANADLAALQADQLAINQVLIAQVATAYFDLREYDLELELVNESIRTRQESVKLVEAREQGGVANRLEVDQAKTLVASARADAALLEKAREQTENLISYLLGRQPGPITRGLDLVSHPQPPQIPAGLPSSLLERRPDLRIAEQRLVAANARVGVAKAAFYPSLNLTAAGGVQSADLLGIISRAGFAYSMAGIVDVPIFDAGRRSGNYKTAEAQANELVINYQKTIAGAFRDVSDALVGYQKTKEYSNSVRVLTETLRDQSMLANARYVGGVTSYLEVLDTERQRLSAEQQLAQSQRDVLTSLVQLYKALGGGWQ